MAAGISADFVSDGKYLKVTHTLVNVSDKTMERVCIGQMQIFRLEAMTQHLFTEPERDLDGGSRQSAAVSLACKKAPGAMIYLPCGLDTIATDRVINLTIPVQTIQSEVTAAWPSHGKIWSSPPGERITRSVLFSVGEIADPPVLSKDPFSFTLEAEGKKEH